MEEKEKEFSEAFAEFATGERKEEEPAIEFEKDGEPVEEASEDEQEVQPEAQEEEEPVAEEQEETADDGEVDWAERAQQLEQEIEQWKHKFYSDAGRVGALQKKINELEAQLQSRSLEQPQAEAAADDDELPPELAEFKEDYPDIYEGMRRLMDAELQRRIAAVEQEVRQSLEPVQQVISQQTMAAEIAALEAQHPDWQEVATDPAFSEWLAGQPETVQQMAASDFASDVSFVLSAFKTQTRAQQPQERPAASGIAEKRKKQLEDATSVPSRGSGSSTPLADDDYDSAFAYYASRKANSR